MNEFLKHNLRLFIIAASVAVIVTVFVIVWSPFSSSYDVSFSISVTRVSEGSQQEYAYGGYYVIQAAESITDMVQQWLRTPEVVVAIMANAGIENTAERLSELERRFFVRKRGAQYVEVRTSVNEEALALTLTISAQTVLEERLQQLGLDDAQGRFRLVVSEPVVVTGRAPLGVSSLMAAVAAIFLVGLWQLANPPRSTE